MIRYGSGAAAAAAVGQKWLDCSAAADTSSNDKPFDFKLEPVGKLKTLRSNEIDVSPFSVGFEVLDRKRFDPTKTYEHLANLGVKWARCQTGWNRCERVQGQFTFDWLDEVVDSLLKIGVQPWFNLGYGNQLYTPDKPDDMSVGWAPVFDDAPREAWLRFVDKLAEHFADRVMHWEIWNEPNIKAFWKPNKPNAADYLKMVKITAPLIRQRVANAVIIGGAFAGVPKDYIQACLESGLADHVDRISYHPYRPAPEANYDKDVGQLREMIEAYSKSIKLWQGENGCPSQGGPESTGALSNLDWDEQKQAKWVLRRILSDLRLDLELTSYFHTVDLVGYRGKTNFKGLLRGKDYTRKPSYFAYQSLCTLFAGGCRRIDQVPELIGQTRMRLVDGVFRRDRYVTYAWWYPENLFQTWEPRSITVRITLPKGSQFDAPVLIDPLSQRVYRFPRVECGDAYVMLKDLPLLDYPLLVADKRVVPM
jgi:hypothetical protein